MGFCHLQPRPVTYGLRTGARRPTVPVRGKLSQNRGGGTIPMPPGGGCKCSPPPAPAATPPPAPAASPSPRLLSSVPSGVAESRSRGAGQTPRFPTSQGQLRTRGEWRAGARSPSRLGPGPRAAGHSSVRTDQLDGLPREEGTRTRAGLGRAPCGAQKRVPTGRAAGRRPTPLTPGEARLSPNPKGFSSFLPVSRLASSLHCEFPTKPFTKQRNDLDSDRPL